MYFKFSQLKPTIKLLYILYINNKKGKYSALWTQHDVQSSKSSIEDTISRK